jgi:hypothetical protein
MLLFIKGHGKIGKDECWSGSKDAEQGWIARRSSRRLHSCGNNEITIPHLVATQATFLHHHLRSTHLPSCLTPGRLHNLWNKMLPIGLRPSNPKKKITTRPAPPSQRPNNSNQNSNQKTNQKEVFRESTIYSGFPSGETITDEWGMQHFVNCPPTHVLRFTQNPRLSELIEPHLIRFDPEREQKKEWERIKAEKAALPKLNKDGIVTQQMDESKVDEKTLAIRKKAFKKRIREWKGPRTALDTDEFHTKEALQEELKKRAIVRKKSQFQKLPWLLKEGIPNVKPETSKPSKPPKSKGEPGEGTKKEEAKDLLSDIQLTENDWTGSFDASIDTPSYILLIPLPPPEQGFRVVPIDAFYSFEMLRDKQVFTTEEAEERMKARNRRVTQLEDRWFLKKDKEKDEKKESEVSAAQSFLKEQGLKDEKPFKNKKVKVDRDVKLDALEEDWDFEMDVSDDEEFDEGGAAWDEDSKVKGREVQMANTKKWRSRIILSDDEDDDKEEEEKEKKNRFEEARVLKRVKKRMDADVSSSSDSDLPEERNVILSKEEIRRADLAKETLDEKKEVKRKRSVSPSLLAMHGQKRTRDDEVAQSDGNATDTSSVSVRKKVKLENLPGKFFRIFTLIFRNDGA